MTREAIIGRIRPIICEHLEQRPEAVTETADFGRDLGADSLDGVEMVIAIEEAFLIAIPDDAIDGITSLGAAADYVAGRLA